MAASTVALKRLSSLILSGSPRPVTLPAVSRFFSSGPLRPVTLPEASRSFRPGSLCPVSSQSLPAASRSYSTNADDPFHDPFYAVCGTSESQSFPPLHHEYMVENLRDGFHICMYMVGVGKGNVKVRMEGGEFIAEGIKEKDYEHEDGTKTLFRYRMLGPPNEVFDLDAIKAEIKNGMLRVFFPRRNQTEFVPRECFRSEMVV